MEEEKKKGKEKGRKEGKRRGKEKGGDQLMPSILSQNFLCESQHLGWSV